MLKDFDIWNIRKQFIHFGFTNQPYLERDIWWSSLGINIGFEQDGDGLYAERPVLIVRGFSQQVCWAIPLTTSQKKNPYYFPLGIIGGKPAAAILSQMRPIDTKRLINKIGFLDQETFNELKKAIKLLL